MEEGDTENINVSIPISGPTAPQVTVAPGSQNTPTAQRAIHPCHVVFAFLNSQLLGALQVEFQSKNTSPFETHLVHMWTFLIAMCFCGVVLGLEVYILHAPSGHFGSILNHVLLISGALSSVSLLSIFQPRLFVWFVGIIGVYTAVMPFLACLYFKTQLLKLVGNLRALSSQLGDNLNLFVGRIMQWGLLMLINFIFV